ncbi:MAG: class I SAM-dependent methyltransferase [Actinomycetota bacterium]|nr:class I SAM-dependent methyltransferase [Actinomycetota bacterium]
MPSDNAAAWDHYAATYQQAVTLPSDVAVYGPDIPDESQLRLLGDLKGKRVLDLGCGGGQCTVAFARAGAAAIGLDQSVVQLGFARRLADAAEVRVELRQGDVADLAFLRADSIDVAFSSYTFDDVNDLSRVFRQVHRVLKVAAPLVFSVPHPAWTMIDDVPGPPAGGRPGHPDGTASMSPVVRRSYFDRRPIVYERDGVGFTDYHHTFAELYMALVRASYKVDTILEPEPAPGAHRSGAWRQAQTMVPRTLVIRARKEGS